VSDVSEDLPHVVAEVPRTSYAGEIVTHLNQDHIDRLSGVFDDIGAAQWLEKNPFGRLELTKEVLDDDGSLVNGLYDFRDATVQVTTKRDKAEYRKTFEWQRVYSVSSTGRTQAEAVQKTLVHELGHHIHGVLKRTDPDFYEQTRRAVLLAGGTQYAQGNFYEYFAESFALYTYQRPALLERDPRGHAMIEMALKRVGMEVKPQ